MVCSCAMLSNGIWFDVWHSRPQSQSFLGSHVVGYKLSRVALGTRMNVWRKAENNILLMRKRHHSFLLLAIAVVGYAWPGLTAIIISLSNVGGFVFTRRVSSSAKLIVRSACAEFISSKHSTVEIVLGTHRATSLADNYSKSKSPPNQSNNMDQSDWRSSQLRLLKK